MKECVTHSDDQPAADAMIFRRGRFVADVIVGGWAGQFHVSDMVHYARILDARMHKA